MRQRPQLARRQLHADVLARRVKCRAIRRHTTCLALLKQVLLDLTDGRRDLGLRVDQQRVERAFRDTFRRADPRDDGARYEYEIVVCHGNVIRYMTLRALQLPPEAWLRLCTFNCSVTYLVVRPTGSVSLRALGDVGHLDPPLVTFSMHHGIEW